MVKYTYFNKRILCLLLVCLVFLVCCTSKYQNLKYKISGEGKYWILDNYNIETNKKLVKIGDGFIKYIGDKPILYEGFIEIQIVKTIKNSDELVKVMQVTSFPLTNKIIYNDKLSIGSLEYTMSGDLEQLDFKDKYDLYVYIDFSDKNNKIFNEKLKLKVD